MTHAAIRNAIETVKGVLADHHAGKLADGPAKALVRKTMAVTSFRGGTHVFRLAGIEGTATSGDDHAVESWLRIARRRLEPKAMEPRG